MTDPLHDNMDQNFRVTAYKLLLARRCHCERNASRDWHILSDHVYSESSWSIVVQSSGITEDEYENGLSHNLSGNLSNDICSDPLCSKRNMTYMSKESPDPKISDDRLGLRSAIDGCEKALWIMDEVSRPEQIRHLIDHPIQWDGCYDTAEHENIGQNNPRAIHMIRNQHGRKCPISWCTAECKSLKMHMTMHATKTENMENHVPSQIENLKFFDGYLEADIGLVDNQEIDQTSESNTNVPNLRGSSPINDAESKTVSKFSEVAQGSETKPAGSQKSPYVPWIYQFVITCTECAENKQYAFRFPNVMRRHRQVKKRGIKIDCTVCETITQATAEFNNVGKKINENDHLPKPIFACDMCTTLKFDDLLDWESHDTEHSKDPHKCFTCGVVLPSRVSLDRHIADIHAPEKLCDVCGVFYKYDRHYVIAGHKEKHQCPDCDKKFTRRGYLIKHIDRYHKPYYPNAKPKFLCNICGETFVAGSTFSEHKMRHKFVKKKCNLCGKEFSDDRSLIRHQSTRHVDERIKYKCKICGKQFISDRGVEIHEKNQHGNPDERPIYRCDQCGKEFRSKNGFEIHCKKHK